MHIKLTNGQPEIYSIGELRRDNPNTSFPKSPSDALLAEWGVYPCTRKQRPDYDALTASLIDGSFEQDAAGAWSQPYLVEQFSVDDASRSVRNQRGVLLSQSDWMALNDTSAITTGWSNYRQALRDVTEQVGFPFSVIWPTEPE